MLASLLSSVLIWGPSLAGQDAERAESAKAGAAAAVGGLLGSLPFLAAQGHGAESALLSAAQVVASCLLFGVTFRYVHHVDPANVQLKGGAVAAFGLVRPPLASFSGPATFSAFVIIHCACCCALTSCQLSGQIKLLIAVWCAALHGPRRLQSACGVTAWLDCDCFVVLLAAACAGERLGLRGCGPDQRQRSRRQPS
jgi:hypothetical protein